MTTIKIRLTRRSSDYHACLQGQPGLWGCGKDQAAAVEAFLRNHPSYRGLEQEIVYEDQQRQERERIADYALVATALHGGRSRPG